MTKFYVTDMEGRIRLYYSDLEYMEKGQAHQIDLTAGELLDLLKEITEYLHRAKT